MSQTTCSRDTTRALSNIPQGCAFHHLDAHSLVALHLGRLPRLQYAMERKIQGIKDTEIAHFWLNLNRTSENLSHTSENADRTSVEIQSYLGRVQLNRYLSVDLFTHRETV